MITLLIYIHEYRCLYRTRLSEFEVSVAYNFSLSKATLSGIDIFKCLEVLRPLFKIVKAK